tara:strand:+ start:1497 stop:2408 length:912 start_codon:yes stop_codon:yes gene_type:complete
MKKIKLALDWTPNINHIGFFVANKKGYYKENDLKVEFSTPKSDNYSITPAKKVEMGISDFGLCPTESLISFRTKKNPFVIKGLMTIFKEDVSAIATIKSKKIIRPRQLDGKSYASYKARYEDEIVKKMIVNDGGKGNLKIYYPQRLGVWNTLIEKKYDSTWIFINWEGVEASKKKIDLELYKMSEFNIPYSYSPILFSSNNYIQNNPNIVKKFIESSREGYQYCYENMKEVIDILNEYIPESDYEMDLLECLNISKDYFGPKDQFGKIDLNKVDIFLKWLNNNNIENNSFEVNDIISKKGLLT